MPGLAYPMVVFRTHRGFGIFSILAAGALQFLVIKAITTIDVESILSSLLTQLPERFRAVINETLISRVSVEGAAAFGLNHPIVMVLIALNAVMIPTRHLSGEIEDGTMELLLAHPVGRARLVFSLWATAGLMNLAIVCGALLGCLSGVVAFHTLNLGLLAKIIEIGLNLWLLSVFVGTLALLASTYAPKGSRPALWTAAVVLTFYVVHFLTPLWEPLKTTVPFNVFTYYQPQKLMFDERSLGENILVLGALIGICLSLALRRFSGRDIPG